MTPIQQRAEYEAWLADNLREEHGPEVAARAAERLADELARLAIPPLIACDPLNRPVDPPERVAALVPFTPPTPIHGSSAAPHRVGRTGGPCLDCGCAISVEVADEEVAARVRLLRAQAL